MERRDLIKLAGGFAALWPLMARAQQSRIPTIGVLLLGVPDPAIFLKSLHEGLRDRNYLDGRNVRLEIRSAGGDQVVLAEKAAELVRSKVDIIVAFQTPAALAAKQVTDEIPIVMGQVGDPVASGLVASFARPGGNVTGFAGGAAQVVGKVVELTRELLPSARRVAALANRDDPFSKLFIEGADTGARKVGMEMEPVTLQPTDPLEPAFELMSRKRVDAVITMTTIFKKEVVELAMQHRLPLLSTGRVVPALGGLASYSPDYNAQWRDTADYIDKILKGSKPADLPVAFPTKFELIINVKTSKALGLTISPTLLGRADEVIE
ncbi:MAG: ABC transporter substrate-binding protein [Bradyrhizobium sp.]|nr:ABC transporter substrate-binding protein [Bradyrhizobium sp.]